MYEEESNPIEGDPQPTVPDKLSTLRSLAYFIPRKNCFGFPQGSFDCRKYFFQDGVKESPVYPLRPYPGRAVRERAERGIPGSTERTQVSLFILRGFFILWANAFKGHLLYGVRDLQNLLWIRL